RARAGGCVDLLLVRKGCEFYSRCERWKLRPQSLATGKSAKTGRARTAPFWPTQPPAARKDRTICRTHAASGERAASESRPPLPPARRVPAPGRARSPARPHLSPTHVPAGARACSLIPRLPAPAAPLAFRCRRPRATGVSLLRETPFALSTSWPPCRQAESDARSRRTGVLCAKRLLTGWLAAAVTPWSPASRQNPGSLRGRKDVPRSGARASGRGPG
ncbi:Hypothetical predicted protein, partial [Marmota monax]